MNDSYKLIQFRNYMMSTRNQFIEMYLLDKLIQSKIREAKQVKKENSEKQNLVFHFSLILFLYGIIGVVLNISLTYTSNYFLGSNILYKYLFVNNSEYIVLSFSFIYFILANLIFFFKIKKIKSDIRIMKLQRKYFLTNLKSIYKRYENPPVIFELSMPDTLTELIKYANSGCDSVNECVEKFIEDYNHKT